MLKLPCRFICQLGSKLIIGLQLANNNIKTVNLFKFTLTLTPQMLMPNACMQNYMLCKVLIMSECIQELDVLF